MQIQIFCYNKKGKYNVIPCNTSVLSDIFYYNVVHALYVSNDYSNFSSLLIELNLFKGDQTR